MSTAALSRRDWSPFTRYRRSLWLLTTRDLKVRYSTSFLGYLWSILDPLAMSAIYWFVFTQVFHRGVGHEPYIVFLLSALLPWMWFTGAISDCTRAFTREAKLIRSTTIPPTIWVARLVLAKGIEFVASIPVIAVFAVLTLWTANPAQLHLDALWSLLAIVLQLGLTLGIGLIVAPLVVFFRDLERAVKLVLRFAFYASPIIYGLRDLPTAPIDFHFWGAFNPLAGIFSLYRAAFFPAELDWFAVGISAVVTVLVLALGFWVFRRTIRTVLKEI
ncbi:ABC transporter permease [Protaetiibacter larvae]|uniref:Transport permease protein n=1 Tax=Protaetiibacter larvae TaxID=2592654 RepID=A0A5C1YBH1_9MICO|nr:ABC transporter permease [Protaetiibacter larvae]QEO10479.1 ABC transporter permease [Protaetiibacter larvae]